MRKPHQDGYGLLILIVVLFIGSIVIAGALNYAENYVRNLNIERKRTTDDSLRTAFGSIFPDYVNRRTSNMFDHFGYSPIAATNLRLPDDKQPGWDLRCLLEVSQVQVSDPTKASLTQATGAIGKYWNGPYWYGSIGPQNCPVDGWGRLIELRYVTSPTAGWILHSRGLNGVDDSVAGDGTPHGDDQIYPISPYVPPIPPTPGTCPNPPFQFHFTSKSSPNDLVEFTIITMSSRPKILGQFNNGNPGGFNWTGSFTNIPYGTHTIIWMSQRNGSGEFSVMVNPDCTVTPTVINF